jgi:hypothetical protein
MRTDETGASFLFQQYDPALLPDLSSRETNVLG